MHIEILVEDSSGCALLKKFVPKILGSHGEPHTWRIIAYKGVGRIPISLRPTADAAKRILLDKLPKLLRGYGQTPGIDCVLVVVDTDRRNCVSFLAELRSVAVACSPHRTVLFRLAIEEIEAWYLGDQEALLKAYPKAKRDILSRYIQDSICGTWEVLADAVHPGGSAAIKRVGFPASGQAKHDWAENIGSCMEIHRNLSPSFGKLRDGLHRLVSTSCAASEET
jgi:hypothetical protein